MSAIATFTAVNLDCPDPAALAEFQPGPNRWRVLTDPAGHPFCVSRKS